MQIIEFADFECPFCQTFHRTLKTIRDRHPEKLAVTFMHFPLAMHRFAIPAARAAECAHEQGRFEVMHDRLFEEQASFGLKSWTEYAAQAAVPDMNQFNACIQRTDAISAIENGKKAGDELGVKATPTVIINGWKLGQPPSPQQLEGMIGAVLAGRSPVTVLHQPRPR